MAKGLGPAGKGDLGADRVDDKAGAVQGRRLTIGMGDNNNGLKRAIFRECIALKGHAPGAVIFNDRGHDRGANSHFNRIAGLAGAGHADHMGGRIVAAHTRGGVGVIHGRHSRRIAATATNDRGATDNGSPRTQTQKTAAAQNGGAQHRHFFVAARGHIRDLSAPEVNQIIRRAPLAPLFGRTELGIKLTVRGLHKRHLVQISIRRDKETVRLAHVVEIVFQRDGPSIYQRDDQVIAAALLGRQVRLPQVQRNFLSRRQRDRRVTFFRYDSTL
mmetsp:Transcript_23307/g.40439  ORF Transcript_23307/g.40439 Transcript_23307/m.40439 type:complete len:273 (-) Transcript_23307:272-1090(-)